MNIHERMEEERRPGSLEGLFGLTPADPDAKGVSEVLEVLSDGECHTISTIGDYLELIDLELFGCELARVLILISQTHNVQSLPPYDVGFGTPQRFKLILDKGAA